MDDFKLMVGRPGESVGHQVLIDDVIFFAEEPGAPPENEPFPNRVLYLAAFDTGIEPLAKADPVRGRYRYWPGELEIVSKDLPEGSWWGVAKAVARKDGKGKLVRLMIDPPKAVGQRTKVRFRYHLKGADSMTVQIFDATDQDNRHVVLRGLKQNEWQVVYVDFTTDGRKNDGRQTPFAAGHLVDDLFFLVDGPPGGGEVGLMIDEVVLYDAGK